MKHCLLVLVGILLVCAAVFSLILTESNAPEVDEEFFFGVSFGGNSTTQAKLLIDKVKDFTNFFLISNWDVSLNEKALNEISICSDG